LLKPPFSLQNVMSATKKHHLRIVGGQYRRALIPVPDAPGLRPTPDRSRETLFNWLRHFWPEGLEGKRVLDLFAGSGALGFEAASHGANHVQLVEQNPKAVASLRAVRDRLGASQVRIHAGDALMVLHRLNGTQAYDLVLLDPPFGQDWLSRLWPLLPAALAPGSLLYVESDTPPALPPEYEILRQSRAGHSHIILAVYLRSPANAAPPDSPPERADA